VARDSFEFRGGFDTGVIVQGCDVEGAANASEFAEWSKVLYPIGMGDRLKTSLLDVAFEAEFQ
jgi:hypothetical protein